MKCRHYDRIVPGCAYCDSIIESERQERAERDRAVIVETLEGRLACETALVDTLRTDVSRLTSALDVALESARSAEHRVDTLRAENALLREALEEQTEAWQSIAHEIDVAGMSRRDLRDLAESLGDRARAALTR